ncbi:MAG TPA: monovalent cation:proton antiporter-2 (CPA2) family protein [Devosiaceae bacterium]|jgi:glutathione-regulated potassium-efflux system protein KefB|nr:monovalent cation:proton antiporter-2 (CPA2) family protein [Devosiaceae bacterium]
MAGGAIAEAAANGVDLLEVVGLLAAGVVAVPIFRRLGLGSVLGYLAAGLVVGPFGVGLVTNPAAIFSAAQLGVVMFLFIIGLEMEPSRLWSLRKQIFGLGLVQVLGCIVVLTALGLLLGFSPAMAFVAGAGFVLTSTAIVVQLLEERGELATTAGQRIVSILLFEDLSIVPLLAIIAVLAPYGEQATLGSRLTGIGVALGAVLLIVAVGRWFLNPLFRILANAKAREVMTAAALLVILGAALIMETGGLSMAMGAFLAGVLLSTSTFRHQLEADVEPFRGLLLGLFFLAVGMSLDLSVVMADWQIIAISVVGYKLAKGLLVYGVARLFGADNRQAIERGVLMGQGGEFAFVLYSTAASVGVIDAPTSAVFTAVVILSMVLTPFTVMALKLLPKPKPSMDGVELADGLSARVLVIGFGRFGQIAVQPLLARGLRLSIIDNDTEMIRVAGRFGRKVYYGDGRRLDVLQAAGAGTAELVLVCVDDRAAATRIVELVKSEFPVAKIMSRAFDRGHAIELVKAGVDYQLRETFESALALGGEAIRELGASDEEVADAVQRVRDFDSRRFELQVLNGVQAGQQLLISNADEQAREQGVAADDAAPDEQKEPAQ